ncbi:MAG: hypothetical protein U0169_01040 [Polyangiaceae bacterium]
MIGRTLHGSRWRSSLVVTAMATCLSCRPDFPERPSTIAATRVLAVVGTPAEVRPGETVRYEAFVASPDGPVVAPVAWSFCATPKRVTETGSVSPECLGDGVVDLGISDGPRDAKIPAVACALFGPDTPPGEFRPRDPDVTGGYYQPVRLRVESEVAFGTTRIRCNLANAPNDSAAVYAATYRANENPVILALTDAEGRGPTRLTASVPVVLRLAWTDASREEYAYYDPVAVRVVARHESLRVSWFATGGSFEHDRTGRDEDDATAHSDDRWTPPDAPGRVWVWAVLRDDRGGAAVTSLPIDVSDP